MNGFHCAPGGELSTNEDAAIAVFGAPPATLPKNSTLADSAGVGVNLAYTGDAIDVASTNSFEKTAGCNVSRPRPTIGSCPTSGCPWHRPTPTTSRHETEASDSKHEKTPVRSVTPETVPDTGFDIEAGVEIGIGHRLR